MKLRQTVEKSWGVWVYDGRSDRWRPWIAGLPTRKAACVARHIERAVCPERRFALVRTVHTRQVER